MQYVSLDIETGGLMPGYSLLEVGLVAADLSAQDTDDFPCARLVILPDPLVLHPAVLRMHALLFDEIYRVAKAAWWKDAMSEGYTFVGVLPDQDEALSKYLTAYATAEGAPLALRYLLDALHLDWQNNKLVLAGKNVAGFDMAFLAASGLLAGSDELIEHAAQNPADHARRVTQAAIEGYPAIRVHHRTLDPAMLYLRATDTEPPSLPTCLERAGLTPTAEHTALGDALDVARLLLAARPW